MPSLLLCADARRSLGGWAEVALGGHSDLPSSYKTRNVRAKTVVGARGAKKARTNARTRNPYKSRSSSVHAAELFTTDGNRRAVIAFAYSPTSP